MLRFAGWLALAVALAGVAASAAAVPLASRLPGPFLASLAPAARARLDRVRVLGIPLMRRPLAFYLPSLELVVYGPDAGPGEMRHEAMHALDPCRLELSCAAAFGDGLPVELRQTAQDLYGPVRWTAAEYWPVLPAWFAWDPAQMPSYVRVAYASVFPLR